MPTLLVKPTVWEPGEPLTPEAQKMNPNLYRVFIFRLVELNPVGKTPGSRHCMEYLQKDGSWVKEKHDYYASRAEAEIYLKQAT